MDPREEYGLEGEPRSEWPEVEVRGEDTLIDRLGPGSDLHGKLLSFLLKRIDDSELAMSAFYARWNVNEKKVQAYIDLPDWERTLKEMNDSGAPPKVTSIIIPFEYATISTIVTYIVQVFFGRKPIFSLGSYSSGGAEPARFMEQVLQYNADHSRMVRHGFQHTQDTQIYGVGIYLNEYTTRRARRTTWERSPLFSLDGLQSLWRKKKTAVERIVYSGNEMRTLDPFMFFPDPRVPMVDVNEKGEYVFWRDFVGRHELLADSNLKWVASARRDLPRNRTSVNYSARALISRGNPTPGEDTTVGHSGSSFMQMDQGTITLIPREHGIGESDRPIKYLFTILNKAQIVQAEPYDCDHGMHPVSVGEPTTLGYGFGNAGMSDYLGPLQDTISWFINSHKDNVSKSLNDMFVVDPSMVEMQDLKNPGPGKLIRLKRAAFGQDVRQAITQFAVQDVTAQHMQDAQTFLRIGQYLSSAVDNLMGLQDSGGRKTATEVRRAADAGASRLAAMAMLLSSQAYSELSNQMILNLQQYLDEDFYIEMMGPDGARHPTRIEPEMLVGDFHFIVHDGTLPLDRIALVDIWKEILTGMISSPQLQGRYDVGSVFEYVAELAGAKNVERFRLDIQEQPQIEEGVRQGNVVPIRSAPSPAVNAAGVNDAERLIGALG